MRDYRERALTIKEQQFLELTFLETLELFKGTNLEGDKQQAIIRIMNLFDNIQEDNPTDTRVKLHSVFEYLWKLQKVETEA